MKKVIALIMVLAMFSVGSCLAEGVAEYDSETPITLYYAFDGSGSNADIYNAIFDKYEEENPNITVELVFIPMNDWPDFVAKVQTMVAGGTTLDLCHITNESCPVFYDLGMLECIDPYIEAYPEWFTDMEDIVDMCQSTFVKEGRNYGIAKDWNNVVTYFNLEMLEEAGLQLPDGDWTPEQFLEYCEKLTIQNPDGSIRYAFNIPLYYFGYEAFFFANGGRVFNDYFSECTINSEKCVEVIQFFQDLIFKYGYAPIPSVSDWNEMSLINEQTAMIAAGRWSVATLSANDFTNVGVQLLPKFNADEYKVENGVGGSGVMSTSTHKAEAMKLAAWTASDYFANAVAEANGYVPARGSLMEAVVNSLDYPVNRELFYTTAEDSYPCECTSTYGADAETINRYVTECLSSPDTNVQEIMDRCAAEVTAIRQDAIAK